MDELSAIIVGGLRSGGVTTNAVNQGLVCLQAILTTHDQMNPEQRAALMRLEQALREA